MKTHIPHMWYMRFHNEVGGERPVDRFCREIPRRKNYSQGQPFLCDSSTPSLRVLERVLEREKSREKSASAFSLKRFKTRFREKDSQPLIPDGKGAIIES